MLYSCFEHEAIEFAWRDEHLEALERLKTRLGAPLLQAATRQGKRVLKAGSYVGVLRLGADTIQILPKIEYGADRERSATRNLLYLLEQAGQFPTPPHSLASLFQRKQNWFELLTHLFAAELQAQWRRGAYRHYQLVEEELPTLKGKWRIADQLRQPARQHRFAVSYDEFTVDNQLNRVLRFVVEKLWRQTRDSGNRQLLAELRRWLDEVTLLPYVTTGDASAALINRLNSHLQPALNLARLFLSEQTVEMTVGETDAFALVFDMNQLFEAFLVGFIQRYRAEILPPALQHCTLHPQTRQHTRHLARTADQPAFRLKPDLAVRMDDQFPVLLDAKYKRLKAADAQSGVSQADFYQMFAYARRYRCPRVVLVYPQTDAPIRVAFQLEEETAVVTAVSVNLHRDLNSPNGRQALKQELRAAFTPEENHGSLP